MKRAKLENTFIEELEKIPNISIACKKVGLSRQTVYRWMDVDKKFEKKVDRALKDGTDNISDLAESKLTNHINNGNLRAIEFWLINHRKEYHKPKRPLDIEKESYKGVTEINMFVVDNEGKYHKVDRFKKINDEPDKEVTIKDKPVDEVKVLE